MIPKYHLESLPPRLAGELREHLGLAASSSNVSVSAAARFLRARRLATLWGGSELPSLFELITGELAPERIVFQAAAMAKARQWGQTLAESGEFLLVRLFRRRWTLVARPLWPALAELGALEPEKSQSASELSSVAYHIAGVLRERGPCDRAALSEALLRRFPILPSSVSQGLRELEHLPAIYLLSHADTRAAMTATRWDLLERRLKAEGIAPHAGGRPEALRGLVRAVVEAAGIVRAHDCIPWFPNWRRQVSEAMADLVKDRALASLQDEKFGMLVYTPALEHALPPAAVAATCH